MDGAARRDVGAGVSPRGTHGPPLTTGECDLDRQKLRLSEHAQRHRIQVDHVIADVGSGLDAPRPKLLNARSKPQLGFVLAEHRERLARFGSEMVDMLLRARGGGVIVLEEREVDDDLVRDITEALTGFCVRLYGRRSEKPRAGRAMKAAGE